jgi:ssDNA-binding Zn-finger/Zn-ribbon topoisomerase 1
MDEKSCKDANGNKCDGYVTCVTLPSGKTYAFKAVIEEVYPMTCPKCGGQLELKYGHGKCSYCGTNYATDMKIVEE